MQLSQLMIVSMMVTYMWESSQYGVLVNPFPNKPGFLCVCSTSLLKTLWEKEKLLITSDFSFSHSVFYPFRRTLCHFHKIQNCRLQTFSVWKSLKLSFGKGLILYHTIIILINLFEKPFENNCVKRRKCW